MSLTERLHSVTTQFDKLRAIRFQDAISKAMPRRKFNRITNSSSADTSKLNNLELREPEQFQPEPLKVQQQLLDDETRALQVLAYDSSLVYYFEVFLKLRLSSSLLDRQVELTSMLDAVQETETKMVEMSALNHLMSTHVLQQAQQIEQLYEQVWYMFNNISFNPSFYMLVVLSPLSQIIQN